MTEIPEEYQPLIADWLTPMGPSRSALLAKYGLTRFRFEKILHECNVPRRPNGAQRHLNVIESGSVETEDAFVQDYQEGVLTRTELMEKYAITVDAFYRILAKRNLPRRTEGGGQVRKAINDAFFDELTPASAWVLGLWITDGWVTSHTSKGAGAKRIGIGFSDEDLLRRVHSLLEYQGKVSYKTSSNSWQLNATSTRLYDRLFELGVAGRGPNRIHFPTVTDDLFPHLVRGVIDGDGSIFVPTGTHRCEVTITYQCKSFLEELVERLDSTLGIRPKIYRTNNKNECWYFASHHKNNRILLPWLYRNSEDIRLDRKYQIARQIFTLD